MANLSNINGKFVVNTAGNIGVGTLTPRNDANTTNISIQSSGTARLFVNNTGASGKEYAIYSSANGDFGIFDYNAVSARLVINSSGNATFAGEITSGDDINAGGKLVCANVGSDKKIAFRRTGANNFSIEHDTSSLYFYNETTAELPIRFFNNGDVSMIAGNVGIGTSSPSKTLHVVGDQLIFGNLFLQSNANGFRTIALNTADGADNQELYLCGGATASSTRGAQVGVYGNEVSTTGGSVVIVAGNVSTGDIDFLTANTQRMIINNAGNVGIGTTSPSTDLHVNSENAEGSLTLSRGGNNIVSGQGVGSIVFPADYNGTPTNYGKIVTYANALSSVRGSIDFKVKSTSGNLLTGLTVYGTFSGVNVGIGTTSPASKLVVRTSTDHNFEVEETGGELRLSALNDARSANIGLQFAASEFNFITGNVGIENTNPDAKLSVGANISSHANGISVNAGAGGGNILALGTTNHNWFPFSNGQNYYSSDQHNFRNSSHGTTFGVWNSTGLGIGTTSPTKTLQVNGSVALTTTATDGTKRFHTYPDDWHSWYYKSSVVNSQSADVMTYYQQFLIRHQDSTNVFIIRGNGNVGIANDNPASLLSVGNTSYGSTARIDCMAADSQNAEIRAFGNTQGTGVVYVGQSTAYGGGIAYNGDGSPAYGDFGTDRVTLFGRSGSTSHKVADWSYNNGDKAFNFYGPIVVSGTRGSAGQVLTSNGNAQATWETPSAGGDFKTKGVTLATVTSSGTTVATTVNASTVTNNSCGVIKFTMGHAANIIVVSFVVYETSNMWFVNRADEGENSNNDNDIIYSGVATNTLTFKAKNSSPSSGYNGVVMIECFPPSMFTL